MQLRTKLLGATLLKYLPTGENIDWPTVGIRPAANYCVGGEFTKDFFVFGQLDKNGLRQLQLQLSKYFNFYLHDLQLVPKQMGISEIIQRKVTSSVGEGYEIDVYVERLQNDLFSVGNRQTGCLVKLTFACLIIDKELDFVNYLKGDFVLFDNVVINTTPDVYDTGSFQYFDKKSKICGIKNSPNIEKIALNTTWLGEQSITNTYEDIVAYAFNNNFVDIQLGYEASKDFVPITGENLLILERKNRMFRD